ncbi:beta strand repeat-containing protein [Ramlibacter tataouinensis]|uniref:RapA2 cadherin-like domain-containing protein n=1 Tax=Ramlibacter tataouinensis TaxID=94132 RepID=A0A127JU63_9BURK|nr:VCBS domain-containing protein [Ramlibacter tataouinensis]AMO23537.1 hypothetical protein UC35_12325 [Ramlibacter tataouinensis]
MANGTSGSDSLVASAGGDKINAGAGDDTLVGGAGSDTLKGDAGRDLFIYNVTQGSAGTQDVYTGGSDIDTVLIEFTRAQWMEASTQQQIAQYLAHLVKVTNTVTGQVSNALASDFTFRFGSSTLTLQMMERLEVKVDGVALDPANALVAAANDMAAASEDGPCVTIYVLTNDSVPDLVKDLALDSGPHHGTVTLVKPNAANASTWYFKYQPDTTYYQYLAAGQTAVDTFSYRVTDANGDTSVATVSVTMTGSNDGPVVAATDVTGGVTELGTAAGSLTDSGTIDFSDVDLADVHTVSAVTPSAGALGTLTAQVTTDTTNNGSGGVVTWNYSVAASALEFLAKDQTKLESFTFSLSDGNGGSVSRTVTVTLTGTNDGPVVASTDVTGGVTEMGTAAGSLTDSGTIDFSDVDLADVHTVSAVTPSAGALGSLTAQVTTDTNDTTGTGGVVTWNYSVAAIALEYLAKDQTKTETFTFSISDGNGGTVSRTVTVTLTGTNDGPVVAATDVTGGVTEMGTAAGSLTDSGTIGFSDVDLIDVHTVSAVTPSAGALGALTAQVTTDTTSTGTGGVVTWNYSVAASALEYLAKDQTKLESFTFSLSDGNGGSVSRTVTVTLTGTNDGPVVASTDVTGGVTEMGTAAGSLTDSGTIGFSDVDLIDVHTVSAVTPSAGALGSLTAQVTTDTTSTGTGGVVTWNYSVAASALEYLAKDQTKLETFTFSISDGNGGTVSRTVTVTLTGTNDGPVVASTDVTGGVTEMGTAAGSLTDSGTIDFSDVDLADVHTVSAVTPSAGALGTLTAQVTTDTTSTGTSGVVTWNYSVAASALEYLAKDQTKLESFTFSLSDGNGGSVSRTVTVTLTGTNDGPVVASTDVTGGVTEMGTAAGSLTDSGTIDFSDVDLTDVHTVSAVTPSAGALGTLTAQVTTDTTSTGTGGVVTWNYSVAAAAVEYLAKNQTKIETFSFDLSDGNGGIVTRTVTVTLTGTNDGPVVAATDVTGGVTEMVTAAGSLSDSGTIDFSDVDLADVHTVSAVTPSAGALGALTAQVTTDTTNTGTGGVLTWNYSVAASALEYLAKDQTNTETFTFSIGDGNGGSVSRTVTVTLTGTNDGPVVAATDVTGGVTEMGTAAGQLTDSGTIDFSDADLTDVHSVSAVTPSAGALGSLTAQVTTDTTSTGTGGVVTWNYSVAASAVEYLAKDQTKLETFTFSISDGNGGTVSRTITVTLTGTNDAATISAATVTGSVTEDASPTTLSTSGTITFDDVDLTDSHTPTVAPVAGNLWGGTLTALVTDIATGAGDGTVTWTYTVANAAVQALNSGQSVSESFTVTISDGKGGTVSRTVTVTINGVNDGPIGGADNIITNAGLGSGNPFVVPESALLANDTLTGGGTLDISSVSDATGVTVVHAGGSGSNGTLTIVDLAPSGGTFSYTPTDGTSAGAATLVTVSQDNDGTINSTAGNDILVSPRSNTVYMFGLADGKDIIVDSGGNNEIRIATTAPANSQAIAVLNFEQVGSDLLIKAGATEITVKSHYGSGAIKAISFAQGGVYAGYTIGTAAYRIGADQTGTGQEDVIASSLAGQTLTGGGGNGNDMLFGNGGADTIQGGGGNDLLVGGAGNDRLEGGDGADVFVFNTALDAASNVDTVADFDGSADRISLSSAIFGGIGSGGPLAAGDFAAVSASASVGAGVNIIYDSADGRLYYDADGGSSANRTQFATVTVVGAFDHTDFLVF